MGRDNNANGPRILLYSQDGLGLGHLRRTSSIAAALVHADEDAAVLSIVDSPLGPFFRLGSGQDCVKLPSIVKKGPGVWEPVGLSRPFGEVSALRRELLRATVDGFQPDLILVDHMPHGAFGELLPILHDLRERPAPPKTVLGLRDIIDAPDVVRRVWTDEGAYSALENCYDSVLIYGRRDIFDSVRQYAFPSSVAKRVKFAGYVCTPEKARYTASVRSRSPGNGADEQAMLVVTAGGGADAYPLMDAALEALPLLREVRPWSAVLITGPFAPPQQRRDLERRGRALKARVRASVSDPLSYVEAADVVVGRAGYSSTVEILRSGTPAVLVPRAGPSAEQRMRTSRFAQRGWVGSVDPDELTGEAVATAVLDALKPGHGRGAPAPTGLDAVVKHLLGMLKDRPVRLPEQVERPATVPAG